MANQETEAARLTTKTFTASEALSAYSVARIYNDDASILDGASIWAIDKPRGITLNSAILGEPVEVQVVGLIENSSWAFIEGLVYAGAAGTLTQSLAGLASTQPIGYATSPTSLLLINTTPLPNLAITNVAVVTSELEMLALSTFETGDVAIRSDVTLTYILQGADYATIGDWVQLPIPTDSVLSVNGFTGVVSLTSSDIPEGTNLYYTDTRIDAYMAALDSLQFSGGTGTQGTMSWNTDEETVDLVTNGAVLQLGQEVHIHARNSTGFDIPDGTPVMAIGTLGASGRILIDKMDGSTSASAKYLVGITTETIEDGTDGKITTFGKIRGIDTTGTPYGETWLEGDVLWVDPTTLGGLTKVKPSTGVAMPIALIISVHANAGTLMVRITPIDENAYEPANPNILTSDNFGKIEIDALGINADELDGYTALDFARLASANTFTANQYITNNVGAASTYLTSQFTIGCDDAGDASLSFRRLGVTAAQLRHSSNGLILSGTSPTTAANLSVLGSILEGGVYLNNKYLRSDIAATAAGLITFNAGATVLGNLSLGNFTDTSTGVLLLNSYDANKQAIIKCTNGNLHLDAHDTFATYINYYSGANIYFGTGVGGYKAYYHGASGNFYTPGIIRVGNGVYSTISSQLQIGDAGYGLSAGAGNLYHWSSGGSHIFDSAIYEAGTKLEDKYKLQANDIITSNTGASDAGKYTKIASIEIDTQYEDRNITLAATAAGHGGASAYAHTLSIRVKQQSAFGNDPLIEISASHHNYHAVQYAYKIVQNTPTTIVDIYAKITISYCILTYHMLTIAGTGALTFYSNQAFVSSVAGSVAVPITNIYEGGVTLANKYAPLSSVASVAIMEDQKTTGTRGGASIIGSQVRSHGATVVGQSWLTNNTTSFILTAGTYEIEASAPAYDVAGHNIYLENDTDSTNVAFGTSAVCKATTSNTRSDIDNIITITGTKTFKLWHKTAQVHAYGLGEAGGGISHEVYARIKITKIG